ncbi:unnamed protein product [Coregonus sp. 'balchen']|nr:unnamed protein product [Coregonus sp. 'balchen']
MLFPRFTLNTQQRCGFRKAAKETTTKKGALEETGPLHTEPIEGLIHRRGASPHVEPSVEYTHPRHFGRLVKPLVFTIGFTACSFGTAAIWQYESLKSRVQSYVNEVRADWLEKLWPQKRGSSQMGIIAANAVVFCCWRVPSLQRSLIKYFTSNPASIKTALKININKYTASIDRL